MTASPEEPQMFRWPVRLSDDAMRAELRLTGTDVPLDALNLANCAAAFVAAGVVLDDGLREQIARQLDAGARDQIVIEGERPVPGEDGRIAWAPGMEPRETARPNGPHGGGEGETTTGEARGAAGGDAERAVDFYAYSRFISVRVEQELARLIPPTEGRDGRDLRGQTVAGDSGEPVELEIDDPSVRIDDDGVCSARIDGVVSFDGRSLAVQAPLVIEEDVSFDTGSIRVDCDVEVGGHVQDRFVIDTAGSLHVRGTVEAATIRTGGDFDAAGGVAGKFRGELEVRGNLRARYLNQITGEIRGNAVVEREMIQCTLRVGGDLNLERGALINGRVTLHGTGRVGQVGSESEERTVIELGVDRRIEACIDEATAAARRLHRQVRELDQQAQVFQSMIEAPDSQHGQKLREVAERSRVLLERRQHILRKRQRLAGHYASGRQQAELHVARVLHRRVQIITPQCRAELREPVKGPLRIRADETGRLMLHDERSRRTCPLDDVASVSFKETAAAGATGE